MNGKLWIAAGMMVGGVAVVAGAWNVRASASVPLLPPEAQGAAGNANEPLQPVPNSPHADSRKIALGKRLFHDPRLSHDDTVSCATCHDLSKGGVDNRARSVGIGNAVGGINAPTVYNSGLNFKQFWNGRMDTLEEQVNGPTQHPKEMGSNWKEITGKLRQAKEYRADFAALYQDGIQPANVRDAIATFERSLNTPGSPFDRYLQGHAEALSTDAQAGYRLFKSYGCASCHQGRGVGGNLYQHMGVMKDYFASRGHLTEADYGRFAVTHRDEDRFVFRVPSLRNVAKTAPYFHDGSAATLDEALQVMASYQLGRTISSKEAKQIVAFLESLTGEYEGTRL